MTRYKVNVFACGGVGMKVAEKIISDKNIPKDSVNFVSCCTSDSDLRESGIDPKKNIVFRPSNVGQDQGSGKIKRALADLIEDSVPALLNDHWEEDKFALNIIIASGAGGTGSTFMSFIARELIAMDMQVVCIVATSDESETAIRNTLTTIQSLENFTEESDRHLTIYPVSYTRSSDESIVGHKSYREVEKDMGNALSRLMLLYNQVCDKPDEADRRSWIMFKEINPELEGRVCRLFFDNKNTLSESYQNIMSVMSIYPKGTEPDVKDVLCIYMADGFSEMMDEGEAIHYVIAQHGIKEIADQLNYIYSKITKSLKSRTSLGGFKFDVKGTTKKGGVVL